MGQFQLSGAAAADVTTPPTDEYVLYFDLTSGALSYKDHAGTVHALGGGIPETLIDAKGDLVLGSADNVAARLAIGANSMVLVADSAQTLGAKWQRGYANGVLALTDGATITWDFAGYYEMLAAVTLGGNRTLAFSNIVAGCRGTVVVTQDGTGSRTLTLPSGSIVRDTGAGVITLSTAAGAIDLLSFVYDGTHYLWSYGVSYT